MDENIKDYIEYFVKNFGEKAHVDVDEIPDIQLYMDQLTTFMESHLKDTARHPGADKILTKTMINNYAKDDLLPPPFKKKYGKDHMILLIYIYYLKGMLSIGDISKVLSPITDTFFENPAKTQLTEIYTDIMNAQEGQTDSIMESVREMYEKADSLFENEKEKDREKLRFFALISFLGYDVYLRQLLMEKLIDEFAGQNQSEEE